MPGRHSKINRHARSEKMPPIMWRKTNQNRFNMDLDSKISRQDTKIITITVLNMFKNLSTDIENISMTQNELLDMQTTIYWMGLTTDEKIYWIGLTTD